MQRRLERGASVVAGPAGSRREVGEARRAPGGCGAPLSPPPLRVAMETAEATSPVPPPPRNSSSRNPPLPQRSLPGTLIRHLPLCSPPTNRTEEADFQNSPGVAQPRLSLFGFPPRLFCILLLTVWRMKSDSLQIPY
ncbi:histone-lysine N-methyltransferase 2D-like [Lutra lutra]|uniref:histone-lysine N-methyltransferase 2D-like n=1 Tax=Lutra lutra TaxID=9657 RepID=UPI001FCFAC65|nr:histone-lysine N-methyltransferase 2D-like [Lutra lutra]